MDRATKQALLAIVIIAALLASLTTAGTVWLLGEGADNQNSAGNNTFFDNPRDAPEFTLINKQGEEVTHEDLRGKVWIANFIFTECNGICPIMTHYMGLVRDRVKDKLYWPELRIVSISLDPETDTPARLRQYAAMHNADGQQWWFLTAEQRATTWQLSEQGFNLPVQEQPNNEMMPIRHSGRFVLIDREGRIRGIYEGQSQSGIEALLRDIERLFDQPGAGS